MTELKQSQTLDNVIIKPMLTTNLNATYDDFVPYTGNTGRLNGDVAELKAQSVKKDNVVNNQTTTEEGFALDARQANPNLDDTLAKQISDLNGDVAGLAKKATFERNNSIFSNNSPFLTGDTAGRFAESSYGWSSTEGHVIEFNNAKDEKTHCSMWVDIPAHSALFLQAYSPNGATVEVKSPLLFYNERDTVERETISCDVTATVGTEVSIAFNPIVIKNV